MNNTFLTYIQNGTKIYRKGNRKHVRFQMSHKNV